MANVRLTWTLPTVSATQRPIDFVRISSRDATTLPWTAIQDVSAASNQELLFADEPPGQHFYQAVVFDIDGVSGAPVETSADVPFDAPGSVTNLTASVE